MQRFTSVVSLIKVHTFSQIPSSCFYPFHKILVAFSYCQILILFFSVFQYTSKHFPYLRVPNTLKISNNFRGHLTANNNNNNNNNNNLYQFQDSKSVFSQETVTYT